MKDSVVLRGIPVLVIASLYGYSLLFRPLTFNFQPNYYDHYLFFEVGLICFIITVCYKILRYRQPVYSIKFSHIMATLFVAWALINLTFSQEFYNEHYTISLTLLMFFLIAACLTLKNMHLLIAIFFAFYLLEIAIAVNQTFNSFPANRSMYIAGTMLNSGIFSCYLVIHIPLLFSFLWQKGNLFCRVVFSICVLTTIIILFFSESRTAVISLIFISFAIFISCLIKREAIASCPKFVWLIFIAIASTTFICALGYMFFIKQGSSVARLLIFNIAASHLHENIWMGIGFGKFNEFYPLWQIEYFRHTNQQSNGYFLHAGESYYAFNEYLQILIELGVIRFALILFCIWRILVSKIQVDQSLRRTVKITVVSILLCGLTSYPLHSVPILFILLLLSLLLYLPNKQSREFHSVCIKRGFVVSGVITLLSLVSLTLYLNTGKSRAALTLSGLANKEISDKDKLLIYKGLHPILSNESKFLINYGELLSHSNKDYTQESINILGQANEYQITYNGLDLQGNAYIAKKDYKNAVKNFKLMSLLIPSKFAPRFNMLKCFQKTGQFDSAAIVARQILKMPVKIQSHRVEEIIKEAKIFLDEQHNVSKESNKLSLSQED